MILKVQILNVNINFLCLYNVQETCNLIIDLTKKYLDPSTIFQIEVRKLFKVGYLIIFLKVEEALDKLKISLKTLKDFKSAFQSSKANLPSYFKEDEQPKTWDFQVKK